jgi:cell shape-determining protein MreD
MNLLRAAGLLGVAYVALLLCTTLPVLLPGHLPMPDVTLLVAMHAGLTCRLSGGAALSIRDATPAAMVGLGLCLGYLADLMGDAPKGLNALGLALLVLILRSAATQLLVRGVGFIMIFAALCAVGYGVLFCCLRAFADHQVGFAGLLSIPGQAVATAVCAPPLFALLRRVDRRLWQDPRAQGLTL